MSTRHNMRKTKNKTQKKRTELTWNRNWSNGATRTKRDMDSWVEHRWEQWKAGQTTRGWCKEERKRDQKPGKGKELYEMIKCTVHLAASHIVAAWITLLLIVIQCLFVLVVISNAFMLSEWDNISPLLIHWLLTDWLHSDYSKILHIFSAQNKMAHTQVSFQTVSALGFCHYLTEFLRRVLWTISKTKRKSAAQARCSALACLPVWHVGPGLPR